MAGAVWAGVGGVFVTVVLSFALLIGLSSTSTGLMAGVFAGIVFLGGGALCFVKSRPTRGFAVGLMTGWALLSITTAGFCTGLSDLHIG